MGNEILLHTPREQFLRLDPRTKLLLMLVTNTAAFNAGSVWLMAVFAGIPLFLLWANRKHKAALICALVYAASALANEFLVPATQGVLNLLVVMISGMSYRMMPGFIMGYYLVTTTTVSEFVAAMERMHVSQKIIIPLSVMFRFFPTVGEEAGAIHDAMRMRGLTVGSKKFFENPLAMVEYRLIPLLISTVKIGDELSAAALTRGLGGPVKRTNICKIGFSVADFALAGAALAAFTGYLMQ